MNHLPTAWLFRGAALLLALGAALWMWHGKAPRPVAGQLASCWRSPNCVSSQADPGDREHFIAPLPLPADPETQLPAALGALRGAGPVTQDGGAYRVTCRTPRLRFADDVDLVIDTQAGVVHVRSSSRLGHSDMGVNRRRVNQLREHLSALPAGSPP